MKRLYLMITITNRVVGSGRFVDFYRAFGCLLYTSPSPRD